MHTKNLNQILSRPMTANCLYSGPSFRAARRAAGREGRVYRAGRVWLAATAEQFRKLYPDGVPSR